jgi:hypothetical protein
LTARQYTKNCNKCGSPILMRQKDSGGWEALEPSGTSLHQCASGQNQSKTMNQPVSKPALFTPEQETEIKRLAVEAVRAMMMEAKN